MISGIKNLLHTGKNKVDKLFPHGLILLYHRISNVGDDPFRLCISPENFDSQLKYLKKKFDVIPLSIMVEKMDKEHCLKDTLSITFDDGYEDNYTNALPILEKHNLPVTVFVTSDKLDNPSPYYWDENTNKSDRGRAMLKKQLIELSRSPYIEIGSHTLTHPHLTKLDINSQKNEIVESKHELEKIINKKIKSFSYPFGTKEDISIETEGIVRLAEYQLACANWPGLVTKSTNKYLLPRIIVRNWDAENFKNNLDFWL